MTSVPVSGVATSGVARGEGRPRRPRVTDYGSVDNEEEVDILNHGQQARPRRRSHSHIQRRHTRHEYPQGVLGQLERFSRRTLSSSLYSEEIAAEVSAALATADEEEADDDEEDEDQAINESTSLLTPQIGVGESGTRESEHAISNFETIIHILKGNIGLGVLTIPMAIRNSGLMLGSVGLILIACVCVHCMKMLVGAAHKACGRRPHVSFMDYADAAEATFVDAGGLWASKAGFFRRLINTFLCFTQVGSNAVYVLFMAQNIQPIFQHYGGDFFESLNYRFYILALLPPMIAVCCIRNLRYLSPFSILANVVQFVGLSIIFGYIFLWGPLPSSSSVPWVASASRLPLFFGTAIFAIEGIAVVLPIENQMRRPNEMLGTTGVLNTSMCLVVSLYVAMGFYGYLKFGEDIQSSITLNLPPADIAAQLTLVLFALSIFFSYALQFYVLMEIVGPNVLQPHFGDPSKLSTVDYFTRALLNIITFALAATVPWLDLVVSLLGAVKMSMLALMAPALIDTASIWAERQPRLPYFRLIKNMFVFGVGLGGCILGTYVSLVNIIRNFSENSHY